MVTVVVSEATMTVATIAYDRLTPGEVKEWLEWAGAKLLALNLPSPAPKEPHVAWPAYADDATQAYGYTSNRLRAATPRAGEIVLMDELLALPSLVKAIVLRRILHARALVTPISGRYLYSWTKLGYALHTDPRRVVRMHHKALVEIALQLPADKVYTIRQTLSQYSNDP